MSLTKQPPAYRPRNIEGDLGSQYHLPSSRTFPHVRIAFVSHLPTEAEQDFETLQRCLLCACRGYREDELAMGKFQEQFLGQVLCVEDSSLLVARWAKVESLAREGTELVIVTRRAYTVKRGFRHSQAIGALAKFVLPAKTDPLVKQDPRNAVGHI